MSRVVGIIIVVLILAIAGGIFYFVTNIGPIVKREIEKNGSAATGTTVTLGAVTVSLRNGSAVLEGFSIDNPDGYSVDKALKAAKISATLDLASLAGKGPIVIKELVIEGPALSYEGEGASSNLSTIQKHISDYAKAMKGDGAPANDNASEARKIVIDTLLVKTGTLSITHPELDEPIAAELPELRLHNIGKNSGGATYPEIAQKVLGAMIGSATSVAAEKLVFKTGPIGGIVEGINNILGR